LRVQIQGESTMTVKVTKVQNNFAHLRDSSHEEFRWILVDAEAGTVFGPFFKTALEPEAFADEVLNQLDRCELENAKYEPLVFGILRERWRLRFQQTDIILSAEEAGLMMENDGNGSWSVSRVIQANGATFYPGEVFYRTFPISPIHSRVEEVCEKNSSVLWDEVPNENLREYITRHFLWQFVSNPPWRWRGGPTPDIPARVATADLAEEANT